MFPYVAGLRQVMECGVDREGRNGMTRALFGMQMRYDLRAGFPAVTTKRLYFGSVKAELLGFLRGYDHAQDFEKLGARIWNANAAAWDRDGYLGRIYGIQWRQWRCDGIERDQLADVITQLRVDPHSRQHVVTAWNPCEISEMALPPCHVFFQFFVADGGLSLQMYQRSCDMFLGVPFNIASYALLLSMVAQLTDLVPHELIHTLGDAHIYHAHLEQVKTQITRTPYPLPRLVLNQGVTDIDDFKLQDIRLVNYRHHPEICGELIV